MIGGNLDEDDWTPSGSSIHISVNPHGSAGVLGGTDASRGQPLILGVNIADLQPDHHERPEGRPACPETSSNPGPRKNTSPGWRAGRTPGRSPGPAAPIEMAAPTQVGGPQQDPAAQDVHAPILAAPQRRRQLHCCPTARESAVCRPASGASGYPSVTATVRSAPRPFPAPPGHPSPLSPRPPQRSSARVGDEAPAAPVAGAQGLAPEPPPPRWRGAQGLAPEPPGRLGGGSPRVGTGAPGRPSGGSPRVGDGAPGGRAAGAQVGDGVTTAALYRKYAIAGTGIQLRAAICRPPVALAGQRAALVHGDRLLDRRDRPLDRYVPDMAVPVPERRG